MDDKTQLGGNELKAGKVRVGSEMKKLVCWDLRRKEVENQTYLCTSVHHPVQQMKSNRLKTMLIWMMSLSQFGQNDLC